MRILISDEKWMKTYRYNRSIITMEPDPVIRIYLTKLPLKRWQARVVPRCITQTHLFDDTPNVEVTKVFAQPLWEIPQPWLLFPAFVVLEGMRQGP